ncbi:MAG: c-type cytochrome, partial [Gammaproteobacteria bacterium]|nr:c-type cytochrome [Gammaproteobacteria bacterium]
IPNSIVVNPNLVALGEKLFNEPRMSNNNISCASCHNYNLAGSDGLKTSKNIQGGNDLMNTPTIFNVGLNPLLTWFGRNLTLEEQIDKVLANKKHMDGNWVDILNRLKKDSSYTKLFNQEFSDGLTRNNVKHAIASFERTLITPDSPFDNYLRGDTKAISNNQIEGFKLFKLYGCISCHQGINVGGNLHAKLGTFTSPFKKDNNTEKSRFNRGLFNLTNDERDLHVFRVPSLRNVAVTAPYFHSGAIKDLSKAVKFMAKYQTGRQISDNDAQLIADFLASLTGQYQGKTIISQYDTKGSL